MRTPTTPRWPYALAALALVAGACASDESDDSADATIAPEEEIAPDPTDVPEESDDADADDASDDETGDADADDAAEDDESGEVEEEPAPAEDEEVEPEPLTASDIGVSETTITVGLGTLDPAVASLIGGIDPEQVTAEVQQAEWQVYVDSINDDGGINGRMIEPVYREYSPFDPAAMVAACTGWTQDDEVFAVFAFAFFGSAPLCVAAENDTIMFQDLGDPTSSFEQAEDRLFAILGPGGRLVENMVADLDATGALDGATIGVLTDEGASILPTAEGSLLPTLEALGYEVAEYQVLSSDAETAASQVPLAITAFKDAGVDVLLPVTGITNLAPFAEAAAAQEFTPSYYVSDFAGNAGDTAATLVYGPALDGMLAISGRRVGEGRVGLPEAAPDVACREIYEAGTGETLEPSSAAYEGVMSNCATLHVMFREAATAAGPNLTRDTFASAFYGIGPLDVPYLGGTQDFAPDLAGGGSFVRTIQLNTECSCWEPVDDFRPAAR